MRHPESRRPVQLLVAAVVVAAEGLVLLGLGVVGLASIDSSRVEVGLSVAVFLAAYGVGLLASAWSLAGCHGWTRGPVLITQLLALGLAWNARGTPVVAVPLGLAAVAVVAALLQPAAVEALDGRRGTPEK